MTTRKNSPAASSGPAAGALSEIRRGLLESIPLLVGLAPFALVLGAEAAHKGLTAFEVPLMTGLNFAGGSEFAAIELWTWPPNVALIAAVTLLVNIRYILMSATFAPYIQHLPKRWLYPVLFLMVDESWAVSVADAKARAAPGETPRISLPYYLALGIALYATWIGLTTLGAVIGPVIGDLRTYGFDMAFPAVFLVLLKGMWPGFKGARPWLISLIAAAVCSLILPGAWYVAAGVVAGIGWAYLTPEKQQ